MMLALITARLIDSLFGFVIADCSMLAMNGLDFNQEMSKTGDLEHTPILMVITEE